MFRFLVGLIDCALGRNQKTILKQQQTIDSQKANLLRKDKQLKEKESLIKWNHNQLHKSTLDYQKKVKEMDKMRDEYRHLALREEEEYLKSIRKNKIKQEKVLEKTSTADLLANKTKKKKVNHDR